MIIKNVKKFQAGGTITARNEFVPVDFRWADQSKAIDTKAKKMEVAAAPLDAMSKYNHYKLDGLESDKSSLYNEIEGIKSRMEGGLSDNYTREAYENDAKTLHRLITVDLADQSQKESRYKEVQTVATNAKSDMAINNGQAFVMDVVSGKYDIVPVDKMLTQRATGKDGKTTIRYIPQTVGTALEIRESDPGFTARHGGKGQLLENILHSIHSTKDLQSALKTAFSGVGITGTQDTNLESIGGAPVGELYNMVAEAMGKTIDPTTGNSLLATTSQSNKTNRSQLNSAYQLLRSSAEASGIGEVLRRNAYISYMNEYGDKSEAPNYQDYVNRKVDEQLNNAMLSYLRENHGESLGVKTIKGGGKGEGTGDGSAGDKYELNSITEAVDMPAGDSNIQLADKRDLIVPATSINDPSLFNFKGNEYAAANKLPKTLIRNSVVLAMSTKDILRNNVLLPNAENTKLSDLADGEGLNKAVLAEGSLPTVFHSMPVFEKEGKMNIAWDLMTDGAPGKPSTWDTIVQKATKLANGETTGVNFDNALVQVLNEVRKFDDRLDKMGKLMVRKVIRYDVLVPVDPKGFLNIFYRKESDPYKALVTEVDKASPTEKMFWKEMTKSGEKGEEMEYSGDIYKIPVFSVLAPNTTLRNKSAQWYPTNKIEMSAARLYAGEKQAQQRTF